MASYFANLRQAEASEAAHPDDAEVATSLALNFFLLGQRTLFHAAIDKALKIDPHSAQAYYLAGRFALEAEQDPKKANPLHYAKIGYAHLKKVLGETGLI